MRLPSRVLQERRGEDQQRKSLMDPGMVQGRQKVMTVIYRLAFNKHFIFLQKHSEKLTLLLWRALVVLLLLLRE